MVRQRKKKNGVTDGEIMCVGWRQAAAGSHGGPIVSQERRRGWRSERDGEEKWETLLLNDISEATGSSCYNLPLIDFTDTRWCIYRVLISVHLTCAVSNTDLKTTQSAGRMTARRRHRDTISTTHKWKKRKKLIMWSISNESLTDSEDKKKNGSEKTLTAKLSHLINM